MSLGVEEKFSSSYNYSSKELEKIGYFLETKVVSYGLLNRIFLLSYFVFITLYLSSLDDERNI